MMTRQLDRRARARLEALEHLTEHPEEHPGLEVEDYVSRPPRRADPPAPGEEDPTGFAPGAVI